MGGGGDDDGPGLRAEVIGLRDYQPVRRIDEYELCF
jgi:hypothetical protein